MTKKSLYKRLGIGKEDNPEDMSSVNSLYQNNGYLFSKIDPGEEVVGEDSIDINVKIYEGKQAKINEVDVSGNRKVNDNVIRRELYVRPGELYNRSLLMATIRQLNQMGHFDPEKMLPDVQPVENSTELVDIAFPLEEVANDKFEISGGWGSGMFVGSIGVQLNNIAIKNFFKKGAWRPFPQGQGQSLAVRAQSNGSYYKAFSVNFTEPWLAERSRIRLRSDSSIPTRRMLTTHGSPAPSTSVRWVFRSAGDGGSVARQELLAVPRAQLPGL